MVRTFKPRHARRVSIAMTGLLWILLAAILGGCGGPPNMTGLWQGSMQIPDVGDAQLTLDLQQGDEGSITGTMRFLEEGESPDEVTSVPLSHGGVNDEGSFQVVGEGGSDLDSVTVNVTGEVSGDSMDARFDMGGPTLSYDAERITEEEYRARLEERRQAYEAEQEEQRQAMEEQNLEAAHYEEAAKAAGDRAQGIEARLQVIDGAYGDGPSEQLQDALGPRDPGGDLYACSAGGGASCEVAELEERVAGDREDVTEAAGDDYAPDVCSTVDFSYYEEYDLASAGGAEYVRVQGDLLAASEGLAEDANAAVEKAREAEAARADYEAAGGSPAAPTYTVADVEAMADDAEESERTTEAALAAAGERYAGYERRAGEVVEQGLALREQAGC